MINPETGESKQVFHDALTVFMQEAPAVAPIDKAFPMLLSTQYWTGCPSAEDPYTIPTNWWGQLLFTIGRLQPAQ